MSMCSGDFEVVSWLRFWRWNLSKLCVRTHDLTSRSYFGKMNSTLGSVVPLMMFLKVHCSCKDIEKDKEKEALAEHIFWILQRENSDDWVISLSYWKILPKAQLTLKLFFFVNVRRYNHICHLVVVKLCQPVLRAITKWPRWHEAFSKVLLIRQQ